MGWAETVNLVLWAITLLGSLILAHAVYRRRRETAARLFLGMVAALCVPQVRNLGELTAQLAASLGWAFAHTLDDFIHHLWPIDIAALVIFACLAFHFFLIFPRRSSLLHRWPWLLALTYIPGGFLAGMILTRLLLSEPAYRAFWHLGETISDDGLQLGFIVALFTAGLARLIYACRHTMHPLYRQQIRLILWGLGTAAFLAMVTDYIPDITGWYIKPVGRLPGLEQLPIVFFLGAFALAIQRYQALDVDLIISRSLAYTLLTIILTLLYLLLVVGFSYVIQLAVVPPQALPASLLATLVVVLAAIPLRVRLQILVDRLFYRERYSYRRELQRYSRALASLIMELPPLLELIHQQVERTLHPRTISIFLRQGHEYRAATDETGSTSLPVFPATHPLVTWLEKERRPLPLLQELTWLRGLPPEEQRPIRRLEATVFVPLISRERLLGWLSLGPRRAGKEYTIADLEYLTALADQTSVALENAYLLLERERRISQLTVLNEVGRALSSTRQLLPLLEVIYQQTGRLMDTTNFYIALYDAESDEVYFPLAVEEGRKLSAERLARARRKAGRGLTEYVLRTKQPLLITRDMAGTCARLGIEAVGRMAKSWLGVPMLSGERALGVIAVQSYTQEGAYDEEHLAVLSTIASQAAVAVENAQLYEEMHRRAAELATLNAVSAALSSTLDLQQVLRTVVDSVVRVVDCQKSAIFILDEERGELNLALGHGLSQEYIKASQGIRLDQGLRGIAVVRGETLAVEDIQARPDLRPYYPLLNGEGIRAFADVPLRGREQNIGTLTVYYDDVHHFTTQELELLTTFANQAALAIENARLYQRTDQALAQRVEELSHKTRQLTRLLEVGNALKANLSLEQVLQRIVQAVRDALGFNVAVLSLVEGDPPVLRRVTAAGIDPQTFHRLQQARAPLDRFRHLMREEFRIGQSYFISHEHTDIDYDAVWGGRDFVYLPTLPPAEQGEGTWHPDDVLFVPITDSQGELVGILSVDEPADGRIPGRDTIEVLEIFANQASIAIENARLFQEVTAARERLEAVLNSTRDGILMLDITGRVTLVNPALCALWGMEREAILDRDLSSLSQEELKDISACLGYTPQELTELVQRLQANPALVTRHTYELPGPKRRVVERVGGPVYDADGQVIGRLIVLRDVTEEHELEKVREDLAHMIVHDLRSPLSSVIAGLGLLRDMVREGGDPEGVEAVLNITMASSERLLNLINSLLDISRMETGQMPLRFVPVDMAEVIHDVVGMFSTIAAEDRIAFTVEVPSGLPLVRADEDKVRRVLFNLIDNALKFTPPGGQVTVWAELSPEEDVVVCAVQDTGPGIPPAYQERIFEKFYQIQGQESRRGRGSGLGLAFCKLVVEAHGGHIWVESDGQHGSTFHFTLPVISLESDQNELRRKDGCPALAGELPG